MALTATTVIDDASFELRKDLDGTGGSGDAFDLLLRWVDLTQKDLAHRGVYRHALRTTTTVTTSALTTSYSVTPTDIRRVEWVLNEKNNILLSPVVEVAAPSSLADLADINGAARPDRVVMADRLGGAFPEFYWLQNVVTNGTSAYTLFIFPGPLDTNYTGTLRIGYIKQASAVTAGSDNLIVQDDSREAMAAGVLWRAYQYLGNMAKAQYWRGEYERMVVGELGL